jgi:CRISPR/Cas system CSM-associated protein Csm3 (group 7 of RAMP superfamily)
MARHYHTDPEKKPYRFVRLADHIERSKIVGHHKMEGERWYGHLDVIFTARSPLHVSSGLIVHRDDLTPYFGKDLDHENNDCLILSHVRHGGQRYIPGTSLKGVVRSIVEAITYSCLCHIDEKKIATSAKRNDKRLQELLKTCSIDEGLCPACHLFGTLGYAGRVSFRDTFQSSGGGRIARRPIAHPPQPDRSQANNHRTQGIIYYNSNDRKSLKGRKVYLHGKQPVDATEKYEAIEVCKIDSEFKGKIDINGLSNAELGLLLNGLGFLNQFSLKVGGSKPFGYGSLLVRTIGVSLTSQPLDNYRSYEEAHPALDNQAQFVILANALKAVKTSTLLRQNALSQLRKLMKMNLISLNGKY